MSAAELRLAGDLLEDLESDRLDERDVRRRIAAFGLDPVPLLRGARRRAGRARAASACARPSRRELDTRGVRSLSATRLDRAAFLLEARAEEDALELARAVVATAAPEARVGVGRPAQRPRRSAAACSRRAPRSTPAQGPISSYHDLGSLELLLGLPDATLEAFVDRVLGPVAARGPLVDSLRALLDAGLPLERGCRARSASTGTRSATAWSGSASGPASTPTTPRERMELWLAVKASEALAARGRVPADT